MEMKNKNKSYFLPEEISINILSRLPTLSVIRCNLVRKSWRNLIVSNPEFARMHLLRGLDHQSHHHHHSAPAYYNGRVNFLLLANLGSKKAYTLYYTLDEDDDDNHKNPEPRLRVLPIPYNNKNYYVVGSCNGLICMAYADPRCFEQPVYICNPVTREWLTLPSLTINEWCSCTTNKNKKTKFECNGVEVVCGFGYLPSTDEYKVVRITYCNHFLESSVGRVHVYTLGDDTTTGWRDIGEISYQLKFSPSSPAILANGALHWLDVEEGGGKIVAFDLADEEFLVLPPPPCFLPYDDTEYPFQIQVLGGELCAFHYKYGDLTFGMWFFKNKKNKEEEKKKKNGCNYKDSGNGRRPLEYQSCSWIKEFDIETSGLKSRGFFTPFILTEHGDFLYHCEKTLFCYDMKTTTSKELVGMVKCMSPDFLRLSAIPHLNSFISLKALGEEDTKIII